VPPDGASRLIALFHCNELETHLTSRVTSTTVKFSRPFRLDEIEHELPAGTYRVETEEETLDNVSFVAYRRLSTHIFLPPQFAMSDGTQMCVIHPEELTRALTLDRARTRELEAPL
jgi:hypothetical protein